MMTLVATREALSVVCTHQPDPREGQAGHEDAFRMTEGRLAIHDSRLFCMQKRRKNLSVAFTPCATSEDYPTLNPVLTVRASREYAAWGTSRDLNRLLIPKKQPGAFRPLGIPCIRDRVAQTSAMLVLAPIFEADLQPEQYGYRPERSAQDAVKRIHRLLNKGHNEVVDGDLSNYFGEIPHAELIKSVARRVSDGRMLGLIKAWLEWLSRRIGKGGKRRTNRARKERVSAFTALSNMFYTGLEDGALPGTSVRRSFPIDFCVLGKAPAACCTRLMEGLKLTVNEQKTRCLQCPREPMAFLGYRFGWNYRRNGGDAYIGNRPSKVSVQGICRKISEQTERRYGLQDPEWQQAQPDDIMGATSRHAVYRHHRRGISIQA